MSSTSTPTTKTSTDPLHEPLTVGRGPQWSNRLALAPLTNKQSNADGTLSDDEYEWLVARARGGFGLTMTCAAYVAPAGQAWPGQLGAADASHREGLTRLADGIRAAGSVSSLQLHHGGRRADPSVHGLQNVAPWEDPERGHRALSTAEVEQVVEDFIHGAEMAEQAGFDGVQIHGAHGYLVGQFLDGRSNHRTDGYGGSLDHRSRVLFDIVEGIRARTGDDFQVGVRLTPEGSGITVEEARIVAERLLTSGQIDHLDMSLWDVFKAAGGPSAHELLIDEFTSLPRGNTRLGVAGKIASAADARWCIEHGADFVTIGTAAIIHHDFAARIAADADFVATPQPVTRDHLRDEHLGETFIDYLAGNWDDFVI